MTKVKALVVYGLGIGCHNETLSAYKLAGAEAELIHINSLLKISQSTLEATQIINFSGGFLFGDILGSGMCAVNLIENSVLDNQKKLQDVLWDFSENGKVIYGQCNGFQVLVKSGLLPAINKNHQEPVVSLSHNDCGSYRVDYVPHKVASDHFAFADLKDQLFYLWCRHGEGKISFSTKYSKIKESNAKENLQEVLNSHLLLNYVHPETGKPTEEFPFNPNGSVLGIAGLKSANGRIFGQMAHPEVSVLKEQSPLWFKQKEEAKRSGQQILEPVGLKIFKNIVGYF